MGWKIFAPEVSWKFSQLKHNFKKSKNLILFMLLFQLQQLQIIPLKYKCSVRIVAQIVHLWMPTTGSARTTPSTRLRLLCRLTNHLFSIEWCIYENQNKSIRIEFGMFIQIELIEKKHLEYCNNAKVVAKDYLSQLKTNKYRLSRTDALL